MPAPAAVAAPAVAAPVVATVAAAAPAVPAPGAAAAPVTSAAAGGAAAKSQLQQAFDAVYDIKLVGPGNPLQDLRSLQGVANHRILNIRAAFDADSRATGSYNPIAFQQLTFDSNHAERMEVMMRLLETIAPRLDASEKASLAQIAQDGVHNKVNLAALGGVYMHAATRLGVTRPDVGQALDAALAHIATKQKQHAIDFARMAVAAASSGSLDPITLQRSQMDAQLIDNLYRAVAPLMEFPFRVAPAQTQRIAAAAAGTNSSQLLAVLTHP